MKTVMRSQGGPRERAFLDRGTVDVVTLENLRSSKEVTFGDQGWSPKSHSGTMMFIVSVTNREGPAFFSEPDEKPWGFENWSFVFGSWFSIGTDWVLRTGSQEARTEIGRQGTMAVTESSDQVPMDCMQDGREKEEPRMNPLLV